MRASRTRRLIGTAVLVASAPALAGLAHASAAPAAEAGCATTSTAQVPAACSTGDAVRPATLGAPVLPGNAYIDGVTASATLSALTYTHSAAGFSGASSVADNGSLLLFGMDFDPAATTLYAVRNDTNELGTVAVATGLFTAIGPMTKQAGQINWTDLAIDPFTGTAYASSTSGAATVLYAVDLATAATTVIGSSTAAPALVDLAISCDGAVYGEDIVNDNLFKVDPATAAATLIGPVGQDLNYAQGMDFDNASGTLWAWTIAGPNSSKYGSYSLTTGAFTEQTPVGPQGEFEGAFSSVCAKPAVDITSGPSGNTADTTPTFGFTAANGTTTCSIDQGTPVFVPCAPASYTPATATGFGAYTFRVQTTRRGITATDSQTFATIDCAPLVAKVSAAGKVLSKAKKKTTSVTKKLRKAKKAGDTVRAAKLATKLKRTKKKVKAATKVLAAAKAGLAAPGVC